MGCLSGIVALLALAVPASIAKASLVGAYVVLALLLVMAVAGTRWNSKRRHLARTERGDAVTTWNGTRATATIIGFGVVYAAVIAIIHFA